MIIRPLVAANVLGEAGRPAVIRGSSSGPAAFYSVGDSVTLDGGQQDAKLYSASLAFKMTGAVELMSDEFELPGTDFSDRPVLI